MQATECLLLVQPKRNLIPHKKYITRQQTESNSTSNHSVTVTCPSLLSRQEWWSLVESKENNQKMLTMILSPFVYRWAILFVCITRECRRHVRELTSGALSISCGNLVTWQPHCRLQHIKYSNHHDKKPRPVSTAKLIQSHCAFVVSLFLLAINL